MAKSFLVLRSPVDACEQLVGHEVFSGSQRDEILLAVRAAHATGLDVVNLRVGGGNDRASLCACDQLLIDALEVHALVCAGMPPAAIKVSVPSCR